MYKLKNRPSRSERKEALFYGIKYAKVHASHGTHYWVPLRKRKY